MTEPQTREDYGPREVEAARRVLVDLGQVLGAFFEDSIVIVGGWVPALLIEASEAHVGSIDVDLALDPERLLEGRYAEIIEIMEGTGRYKRSEKHQFKMRTTVDLGDGQQPVVVDVDFLKPKNKPKRGDGALLPGFRPLDAAGCAAAFRSPHEIKLSGFMLSGATNAVQLRVASISDFLVMKAHALAGRDKPKDAYDICFCLDHAAEGIESLAAEWRSRKAEKMVRDAIAHLRVKFDSLTAFGPQQVVKFYDAHSEEDRAMHARRAFELVQRFLTHFDERAEDGGGP